MHPSLSQRTLSTLIISFQVNANDRDPPESGGTINYTFVSAPNEKVAFSIDSSTGVITTRHVSTNSN